MDPPQRPVAIFWDYENCSLHHTSGACEVDNIRRIAQTYGPIKAFKAYLEVYEQYSLKTLTLRSDLQSCGVSLTDCPHNGRKNVADKMMLVDMMTFAMDTEAPATVVILSGDRDFVYAISILRLRGYRTVVIAPKQTHINFKYRASEVLDWDALVVRKQDAGSHSRHTSDIASQRPYVNSSQWDPLNASSPSSSTMLSPMPKSGRRQSFTDDRNATPPRLSHSLTNSTTYLGPLPPSSGKESSFISALRNLTLATGAPESVNEDDDILLSTGPSARSPGQEVKSLTAMKTSNTVDTTEMDGERQYSPSAPSNLLPPRTDEGDISQNGIAGEAAADVPDQADIAPATLGHMPPLLPPAPLSRPSEVPPFSLIQYGHYVPSIRPPTSSTFLTTLRDEKPIQQPTMRMPPEFIPQAKRLTGAATPGSSHPSQSALSANARIESVSTLERDAVRQFLQLIRILDDARLAGTPRMLRTNVAVQLKTYNQNVYTEAGVTRFKDYAALAEERGIVILGGVMGSAWIALHSNWYGRGRFL